ncbi:MAG: hypothetical protein ABJD68_07700 [Nakamurella sp.]
MAMRITKKAWFGPKTAFGWGWTPVSAEGWTVTGVVLVLIVLALIVWPGAGAGIAVPVLVALLLVVALFTGDPPGGSWSAR